MEVGIRIELITFVLEFCRLTPYRPGHRPLNLLSAAFKLDSNQYHHLRLVSHFYKNLGIPLTALNACENRLSYSGVFLLKGSITQDARSGFVYSGYPQPRSARPLSRRALKNPPSIATGGFQNRFVFTHLHGRSPRDAKAILAAFSNAFNKHMFSCEFHLQCLSLFSTLCISYTMLFMSCQQFFFFFGKLFLVPQEGLEPPRLSAKDFESSASTIPPLRQISLKLASALV